MVTVGETLGSEIEEVNPTGVDVQLYVLPTTAVVPSVVELPLQIALLVPTKAAGSGLTVTVTVFVAEQPVPVIVSTSV